ncbi:MAG: winged helix-turn-helix transcriptional regulator [Lachnospiraceae bacterium]|nr:winged helix-turn-helix transcriptional regulator [Lachnospiraceae bacterium]
MQNHTTLENYLPVFQALSSDFRLKILKLIIADSGLTLKQIANELNVSLSTLSPHINKLVSCGLIRIEEEPATHGTQKCCYPKQTQILVDFGDTSNRLPLYQAEIPIGQYSDFDVTPTCGLATANSFLGSLDEPRLFAHPDSTKAGILWFTTGYVEYILPNSSYWNTKIEKITLSFEISSEAPGVNNDWPSRICFSLNGTHLGHWISPGDFGDRRGRQNPLWWYGFLNQYGLMKTLTITTSGCYLDGEPISSVTVDDLALDSQSVMKFRFEVPANTPESHGLTLYGRGFGDYNQHINLMIQYRQN